MRKIIFVLMAILLATTVFGDFTASIAPVEDRSNEIYRDEIAEFIVSIRNTGSLPERYQIYTLNPDWIVRPVENLLEVQPGETRDFTLRINPTSRITESNVYRVEVNVKGSLTSQPVRLNPAILIKSEYQRIFQASVGINARIGNDSVVDPRQDIPIRLLLTNRNALDIDELRVEVFSDHIDDSYVTSLAGNAEVIKNLRYPISSYTSPGNHTVTVRLRYNDRVIDSRQFDYSIKTNHLIFSRDRLETSESSFLYRRHDIRLTNKGNVASSETFSYNLGLFDALVTKTHPESTIESRLVSFGIDLQPGESIEVSIVTDYRPPFYIFLAIVIIVLVSLLLYFTFRSPVVLNKETVVVGEKDGGTSEVKILVNIKNRTGKAIENISLVDRIPGITEIENEFSIGTLKPKKIVRHPKKGTIIKWEFPSMDAYEERIITYRIHSKLGILGDLNLPSAVVTFHTASGIKRVFKSKVPK